MSSHIACMSPPIVRMSSAITFVCISSPTCDSLLDPCHCYYLEVITSRLSSLIVGSCLLSMILIKFNLINTNKSVYRCIKYIILIYGESYYRKCSHVVTNLIDYKNCMAALFLKVFRIARLLDLNPIRNS